jgi:hypothetical protein
MPGPRDATVEGGSDDGEPSFKSRRSWKDITLRPPVAFEIKIDLLRCGEGILMISLPERPHVRLHHGFGSRVDLTRPSALEINVKDLKFVDHLPFPHGLDGDFGERGIRREIPTMLETSYSR